jgi:hypothetical protein
MDPELIQNFRKEVNEYQTGFISKMRNVDGNNEFNRICSSMDWIEINVINYNEMFKKMEYGRNSLDSLYYIMMVDAILQGIKGLHKALGIKYDSENRKFFLKKADSKKIKYDFKSYEMINAEDSELFDSIDKDDDYFSKIRACFGAHVVDISSKKGNDNKYFSSWTGNILASWTWTVFLYNSKSDCSDIMLKLDMRCIDAFINNKYESLTKLIDKVKEINAEFA